MRPITWIGIPGQHCRIRAQRSRDKADLDVIIGAVAFLFFLGFVAAGVMLLRRLKDSLRAAETSLHVAVEERRNLEVELRNSKESSTFAQAAAGVATFDVDVPSDSLTVSGNYFEFLSIP